MSGGNASFHFGACKASLNFVLGWAGSDRPDGKTGVQSVNQRQVKAYTNVPITNTIWRRKVDLGASDTIMPTTSVPITIYTIISMYRVSYNGRCIAGSGERILIKKGDTIVRL